MLKSACNSILILCFLFKLETQHTIIIVTFFLPWIIGNTLTIKFNITGTRLTKKDIKNYYPLIKSGGFIAGHDYHPVYQGVMDGIIETIGYPDQTFVDTSWIKRVTL